jgi:hypothetical protein
MATPELTAAPFTTPVSGVDGRVRICSDSVDHRGKIGRPSALNVCYILRVVHAR